jgi:transcription termination/antitermination protein NusG
MTTSCISLGPQIEPYNWPVEFVEQRWYAVYTCANQEKQVAGQLLARGVEHFLPTFETVRRWKDRRVRIEQPLFSGYLFVRLALKDRLRVLQVPSVVRLVGFNGGPVALSEQEIETLRASLIPELGAAPHPYLTQGRRVRVVNGPLIGTEGILIRRKNAFRVVISVDLIMRAASVEIDAADVERI